MQHNHLPFHLKVYQTKRHSHEIYVLNVSSCITRIRNKQYGINNKYLLLYLKVPVDYWIISAIETLYRLHLLPVVIGLSFRSRDQIQTGQKPMRTVPLSYLFLAGIVTCLAFTLRQQLFRRCEIENGTIFEGYNSTFLSSSPSRRGRLPGALC